MLWTHCLLATYKTATPTTIKSQSLLHLVRLKKSLRAAQVQTMKTTSLFPSEVPATSASRVDTLIGTGMASLISGRCKASPRVAILTGTGTASQTNGNLAEPNLLLSETSSDMEASADTEPASEDMVLALATAVTDSPLPEATLTGTEMAFPTSGKLSHTELRHLLLILELSLEPLSEPEIGTEMESQMLFRLEATQLPSSRLLLSDKLHLLPKLLL